MRTYVAGFERREVPVFPTRQYALDASGDRLVGFFCPIALHAAERFYARRTGEKIWSLRKGQHGSACVGDGASALRRGAFRREQGRNWTLIPSARRIRPASKEEAPAQLRALRIRGKVLVLEKPSEALHVFEDRWKPCEHLVGLHAHFLAEPQEALVDRLHLRA
jgi:hypothetical protein